MAVLKSPAKNKSGSDSHLSYKASEYSLFSILGYKLPPLSEEKHLPFLYLFTLTCQHDSARTLKILTLQVSDSSEKLRLSYKQTKKKSRKELLSLYWDYTFASEVVMGKKRKNKNQLTFCCNLCSHLYHSRTDLKQHHSDLIAFYISLHLLCTSEVAM